jgi:hypothetical protein
VAAHVILTSGRSKHSRYEFIDAEQHDFACENHCDRAGYGLTAILEWILTDCPTTAKAQLRRSLIGADIAAHRQHSRCTVNKSAVPTTAPMRFFYGESVTAAAGRRDGGANAD